MSKSSSFRYAIFGVTAAFMCGFLQALPFWGVPPTQASFARAARGVASLQGLEGYGPASLIDRAAGRLWQLGGASLLTSGQWMGTFLGWTLAALASLGVVYAIVRLLDDARARGILFGSTIALILATCVPPLWSLAIHRSERISDLRLFVPLELVEEVHRSDPIKVFANPAALGHLLLLAPDLAGGISIPESVRLSRNSTQWREGFRRAKWNVVLLSGPIGEYRPLLDHLLASPDWHLASVTNHGFLFRYGSGLAAPSLENSFRGATEQDTAVYLAQIASYYDAIRRGAEARACIEKALALAPNNTTVLSHAATFAVAHKRWQDAIAYSTRALGENSRLQHAKVVQALALFEVGEAPKAEKLANEVLLESPDDPYTLLLSARIHKSLNDYGGEAESLERLIANGSSDEVSTANYRIYLGQAYAKQGLVEPALQNYRAALKSGQLDVRQSKEVEEAIEVVESKRAR